MMVLAKIKKKLDRFFKGAFDYEQATAGGGCCGCVEIDPEVREEYRKISVKKNKQK